MYIVLLGEYSKRTFIKANANARKTDRVYSFNSERLCVFEGTSRKIYNYCNVLHVLSNLSEVAARRPQWYRRQKGDVCRRQNGMAYIVWLYSPYRS
jgi:hypothetical protein